MPKAPIAFFAYNRPEHIRKSLESFAANEGATESDLFIFCDGPKKPQDEVDCALDSQACQKQKDASIKTIESF